jgi:excinuclease ABC subunit C
MLEYAEAYRFEEAHLVKEKLELLENYKAKSTIVSPKIQAVDVITAIEDEKAYFVNYLVVSNGAIIHGITLEVQKKLDEAIADVLLFALLELRERFSSISKEILTSIAIDSLTSEFKCIVPQIGDKKNLVELSLRNAKFYRIEKFKHQKITNPEAHSERILRTIQRDLRLTELPKHMECFDNSNIQGTNPVSACVVFKDGKPSKKDYRHFNVQTVVGPDDFATMEEAVFRRYRRLLDENEPLPQLIIIDGGNYGNSRSQKTTERILQRKACTQFSNNPNHAIHKNRWRG